MSDDSDDNIPLSKLRTTDEDEDVPLINLRSNDLTPIANILKGASDVLSDLSEANKEDTHPPATQIHTNENVTPITHLRSEGNINLTPPRGSSEDGSQDDIPLIQLRKKRKVDESINSDLDISYDSDKDPEFNVGSCQVGNCKGEVWAACPNCEILVCYDHCIEDISSCSQHGRTFGKGKQRTETAEIGDTDELCCSTNDDQRHSVILTESESTQLQVPERFTVEGSAKETHIEKVQRTNKQVEAKAKRNSGQEYISPSTKKKVAAKELKPRCKGSKKCHRECDTITDQQRNDTFKAYYDLGDLRLQREYIVRHIEVSRVNRKTNKDGPSRRDVTKKYFLTVDGQSISVCQTFFLNTLSISEQTARTALSKVSPTGTLENEKRGGRQSEEVIARDKMIEEAVKTHINRFPRVESHFCRSSTSREYLHSDLSAPKMYSMFCKEWSPRPNPPSLRYYEKIIHEMNLTFHKPKKDQCSMCNYVRQSQKDSNVTVPDELMKKYESHMAEKTKVRELKNLSKSQAKEDKRVRCGTFDLQQVIYLPQSLENAIFYKRRLSNYNLTFYDITSKECHCFTWHEGTSKRGSSEISTAVYKALQLYDKDGATEVHLYSDGCAGQNKNSIMPAMMLYTVVNSKNIQDISLRFFESFHGQNEGDCVHSAIGTAIKRTGDLYVPSQLIPVFHLARRNNLVHELEFDDFFDFKLLSQDLRILNSRKDSEDGVVSWNTIMELKVSKDYPSKIFYKTSHLATNYAEISLKRLRKNYLKTYELKRLNTEPNKISKEKYNDLVSLCSGETPLIRNQQHKDFYFKLPHN